MMKSICVLILFCLSANLFGQENIVHWLVNEDEVINCSLIRSGKFLNEETCDRVTAGYSIEIRDNFVIEKIEDGKYYMKSKFNFTTDCTYELTVLECTIPNSNIIGLKVYVEILGTSTVDGLVMIRANQQDEKTFVLRKIED